MVQLTPQGLITTALTLAGLSVNAKQIDVVQVIDQTSLQQLFAQARPLKASIREASKGLRYPIETGAILTDSIVILPLEIHLDVFIPNTAYSTVYPALRAARITGQLLTVQARTGTYKNMFIEEMPHEETTEAMNGIVMSLRFVEAIQVGPKGGSFATQDNFSPVVPQYVSSSAQGLVQSIALVGSAQSYFNGAKVLGIF